MISELIKKAGGRRTFLEHELKGFLKKLGFSVPKGIFFRIGEALPQNLRLKYPLVAKVSSGKISAKSELHGVKPGLRDERELWNAVKELMTIEMAEGLLVEEMAPPGVEVIVGGVLDRQFGPVMMFGLGGILAELFKDVSFGLAPLNTDDADWMIREIKAHRLLEGYRGSLPVDKDALREILIGVSEIIASGSVEEIDLNPVALYPEGALVLDAKMKLCV